MSFIYEDPISPQPLTVAHGASGFMDVAGAAFRSAQYVENFNAESAVVEDAYDARIDQVRKATGVTLENPARTHVSQGHAWVLDAEAPKRFSAALQDLARQHPDKLRDIRPYVPIEADAMEMARTADRKLGAAWGSNAGGLTGWAAMLGGGMTGGLRDPLQAGSLLLGAGPGTARTMSLRILQTAAKEAIINGAFEAAIQPKVQAWRKELGLDNGFDQALRNTLMAAGFAGVLGGAGQSLGEVAGRLLGGVPPASKAADALAGKPDAFAPVADALAPEARGALAAAQTDAALAAARPHGVDIATHDQRLAAALRSAEDEGPIVTIDLTRPQQTQSLTSRPMNVMEFIAAQGGLRDDAGELAARGIDAQSSMTRFGPAWRRKGEATGPDMFGGQGGLKGAGLSPDHMRERLVEAGFLDDAAHAGDGPATTSVADVYDLIDRHLSGETVVSRADQSWQTDIEQRQAAKAGMDELEGRYGKEAARFIRDHNFQLYDDMVKLGIDPLTIPKDDAALAHQLMMSDSLTADMAVERAAIMNMDKRTRSIARESGLQDIPFFGDEHATDAGHGAALPQGGGTNAIGSGKGRVRGERAKLRDGGETPPSPLYSRPPEPEGGIDSVTAPEVDAATQEMLAGLKAEYDQLKADGGELPPDMPDIETLLTEARRPQDLAQLVAACKVV